MIPNKLTRDSFHVFQANAGNALRQSEHIPSVLICAGTGCIAGGAMKIYDNIKKECADRGLAVYVGLKHDSDEEKSLHIKMSGCHGFCEMGPLVHIEPQGIMYIHVKPEDCNEIIEKTILGGEIIDRLVYHLDGVAYPRQEDIPFYKKQHRVVLEHCGRSDARTLRSTSPRAATPPLSGRSFEMTDEEICKTIIDFRPAGPRRRRLPAGQQVGRVRRQKADKKYIVCNGDEGDPGAFMDRSVMEGNPHSVLEGMMIAGSRHRRDEGYIYVRAEYPLAVSRLKTAIEQGPGAGPAGRHILGSGLQFPPPHQPRRRRLRLRRGQRPDRLHRGQARHAPGKAPPHH
jgi:NADH-quinone oxidoreductase subunit F